MLGHTSEYAFAVTEQTINTSILPCFHAPSGKRPERGGKTGWQYVIWQTAYCRHIDEVQAFRMRRKTRWQTNREYSGCLPA